MESIRDILQGILRRDPNSAPSGENSAPTFSNPPQETDPECPTCGGAGWLRHDSEPGHAEFGRAYPCECTLAVEDARRRDRLVAWAGITEPEAAQTFSALQESPRWTPVQRRAWRAALADARAMAEGRAQLPWLVMMGPPGGGKSHLALAVINWRIAHREAGQPGRYVVAPDYLNDLKARMGQSRGDGEQDAVSEVRQRYQDCPLLVLDDLGVEHMTGWALDEIYTLVNSRYRAARETIVSSNAAPGSIPSRVSSRLLDRRMAAVHILDVPDWRAMLTDVR